jgi:hypothetical protein
MKSHFFEKILVVRSLFPQKKTAQEALEYGLIDKVIEERA